MLGCYEQAPAGAQPGVHTGGFPIGALTYREPVIHREVKLLDPPSLRNLPGGTMGSGRRWVDLDGEGCPACCSTRARCYITSRTSRAREQRGAGKPRWLDSVHLLGRPGQ